LNWYEAALLGILEGLTEFLPVSSTGHLLLLAKWMGHDDAATDSLSIVIQFGAVVAVIVYYRKLLGELLRGVIRRDPEKLRLTLALGIAFAPAALVGFFFHDTIKELLFRPVPIAIAAIVGGVVMIAVDLILRRRHEEPDEGLAGMTPGRALAVGLAQCFSLWPGMSRSMTTIVGGKLSGMRTSTAAEFSFLLSIPVLGAATLFDLMKNGRALLSAPEGALALVVGLVSAFLVSMAAIAGFLRYLKRFGLLPFGVYRLILGAVVLAVARS
jgi:undecaprenyl-diphosphatase